MTFGGIEIDSSCRALDGNGEPVEGLFAVGGDASEIYHRGYGGGLCAAVVTGRPAGAAAAERATSAAVSG
jgi:predicted oxidoreductase